MFTDNDQIRGLSFVSFIVFLSSLSIRIDKQFISVQNSGMYISV